MELIRRRRLRNKRFMCNCICECECVCVCMRYVCQVGIIENGIAPPEPSSNNNDGSTRQPKPFRQRRQAGDMEYTVNFDFVLLYDWQRLPPVCWLYTLFSSNTHVRHSTDTRAECICGFTDVLDVGSK